jgi:AcrR family transcriptional regulator
LDKERKIQIIKAAVKRFTKHGLNKTTLDEVARDLRIGKATIYHYFESKEDLYYKTLNYEISLYIEEVKLILNNESKTPKEIIIEYLSFKEKLGSRYKLIFELMLHMLTGTQIDDEIKFLQELFTEEKTVLQDLLKRSSKKEDGAGLADFFVAHSWGMLFSSILINAANPAQEGAAQNEEQLKIKRENFLSELESFFK